MEPIRPSSENASSNPERGSRIGRTLQKIVDKVTDIVLSPPFKIGNFIAEKNVKVKPLKYDDLKIGGVYVLKHPPAWDGSICYQIVKVIEKPPPIESDRSVDIVMVSDEKNEPQYVFASWMRKIKE